MQTSPKKFTALAVTLCSLALANCGGSPGQNSKAQVSSAEVGNRLPECLRKAQGTHRFVGLLRSDEALTITVSADSISFDENHAPSLDDNFDRNKETFSFRTPALYHSTEFLNDKSVREYGDWDTKTGTLFTETRGMQLSILQFSLERKSKENPSGYSAADDAFLTCAQDSLKLWATLDGNTVPPEESTEATPAVPEKVDSDLEKVLKKLGINAQNTPSLPIYCYIEKKSCLITGADAGQLSIPTELSVDNTFAFLNKTAFNRRQGYQLMPLFSDRKELTAVHDSVFSDALSDMKELGDDLNRGAQTSTYYQSLYTYFLMQWQTNCPNWSDAVDPQCNDRNKITTYRKQYEQLNKKIKDDVKQLKSLIPKDSSEGI